MKKIVFIVNSIQQQRCMKRIEEFVSYGYEVEVYGFSRKLALTTTSLPFQIKIIGSFSNHTSYRKRCSLILKSLYNVFRNHDPKAVCYYYFGLDIALLSWILPGRRKYMYEESDLMHTYICNNIMKYILEKIDRIIIRKSVHTVLTSEGFYKYHFKNKCINNITIIPNRLNPKILVLDNVDKSKSSVLRIGFVGSIRYESILNFSEVYLREFSDFELHFWGNIIDFEDEFNGIKNEYRNSYFHGVFLNPEHLPLIYSQIDLVLATYDYRFENVRYAEPNKLYEAIYFKTPIIVSCNTFLSETVKALGIGYVLDPFDDNSIISLIKTLSNSDLYRKIENCSKVDINQLIDNNQVFFKKISLLNQS